VLACVALIVWDRRRRDPALTPTAPAVAWPLPRASTRSALASAAVLVVVSGLAIAPLWAAIALVPALLVVLLRRPVVLGVGSAGLAAVLGVIVVRRVLEHRYFLNAGWTSYFEDLHRPGMFVVVLLLAACIGHDGSVDSAEDRLPSSDAIATADSTTTTGSSGDRMRCAP
jgi:hypothetical protein